VLRGGDVLVAEDGSLILVKAAPQAVLRITACAQHGSAFDLTRAAYHLGNRHVPIELQPDHLKIEPDHVLAEMLRAMHMTVVSVEDAFEPESGAYGDHGGHGHGHEHPHDHPNDHGHDHGSAHTHEPATAPKRIAIPIRAAAAEPRGHVHGPDCKHEH
jgi:urease accessory protein